VSCAEDKSVKVWDFNKRRVLQTHKKDTDRFWITAVHPEQLIFAAGCDSGFIVFNLMKDRIPFVLIDSERLFFFVKRIFKVYYMSKKF
jgi:coatomer protein complex subunit alpha (xenin)